MKTKDVHYLYDSCTKTDHFTVVSLVARPLNENEAGSDLVFIETPKLFLCKLLLILLT